MINDGNDPVAALLPKLLRRAQRLVGSRADAEDIAQEVALRLWIVLHGPDEIEAPERYAMIMLHNLAKQGWRGRRPTEELTDDMAQTEPSAPARIACAELQAAIARLPVDQATLMHLVMMGETSPKVLADRIGVPQGTVMSRLGRARATLRAEMGLDGSVVDLL